MQGDSRRHGERRRSFRASVLSIQPADLLVGEDRIQVRVVDESATGLAVASYEPVSLKAGARARLVRDGVLYEVNVVRVEPRGMGARIGLERLSMAGEAAGDLSTRDDRKAAVRHPSLMGLGLTAAAVVLLVVGSVVGVVLYQAPPNSRDASLLAAVFRDSSYARVDRPRVAPLSAKVRQRVREAPGVSVLRLPEVAAELKLSPEQQARIEKLISGRGGDVGAGTLLASGSELPPGMTAAQVDVQREALALLSDTQRDQLRMVLEQSMGATEVLRGLADRHWPRANSRQLFDRLGSAAFSLDRVIRELGLSDQQVSRIRRLTDAAWDRAEELHRLAINSPDRDRLMAEALAQLQAARSQALELLTPEQRKKLDHLPREG